MAETHSASVMSVLQRSASKQSPLVVGAAEGASVGDGVGDLDGEGEGAGVGDGVGDIDGESEGDGVGDLDGEGEGAGVGDGEGESVGRFVGALVGFSIRSNAQHTTDSTL